MISVVVIGKNEGPRLSACLESIQTALRVLEHEILYVDSCSVDDSLKRAKACGARCYLLAEPQTTAGLGRFAGAKEARGEYLLFLDGDMQLLPGFCEKALMRMDATGCDGVWASARTSTCAGARSSAAIPTTSAAQTSASARNSAAR